MCGGIELRGELGGVAEGSGGALLRDADAVDVSVRRRPRHQLFVESNTDINQHRHNLNESRWENQNNMMCLESTHLDDFVNLETNEMIEMELQRIALSDSLNVTRENYERELKKARSSRMNQEDRLENQTKQEISNWISSDRNEMRQFVNKNRAEIRELEESLERVRKETSEFRDAHPSNSVRSV